MANTPIPSRLKAVLEGQPYGLNAADAASDAKLLNLKPAAQQQQTLAEIYDEFGPTYGRMVSNALRKLKEN
jgi:hypothetical protein